MQSSEQWKPVVGFESYYEVSDHGRVRSISRIDSLGHRLTGRVIAPTVKESGHLQAGLSIDGKRHRLYVHRLVAMAFIGPEPADKPLVRHLDGIPTHNHVSNLKWGTEGENGRDTVDHGAHRNIRKTECLHGHALSGENLLTVNSRRGHRRNCRACSREKAAARNAGRPFDVDLAHAQYERIIGGEAVR